MSGQTEDNVDLSATRYRELAELVTTRRRAKYATTTAFQSALAARAASEDGRGEPYSEAMVKKIERGQRPIHDEQLDAYAELLFDSSPESGRRQLKEACDVGRARNTAPALVQATSVMRDNAARAKKVTEQNRALTELLRSALGRLEESAERGRALGIKTMQAIEASDPESAIAALKEIRGSEPDDLAASPEDALRSHRYRLAGDLTLMLGRAGAAGAGGAAVGAGAAAATFATVAAFATASTGTAISALSGAAATSATLAWLGGGALSVGGMGMAGGVALLTGIVGLAAVTIGGLALIKAGPRMLSKQREQSAELDRVEASQLWNAEVIARVASRASAVETIVTVGEVRVDALVADSETAKRTAIRTEVVGGNAPSKGSAIDTPPTSGDTVSARLAKILINLATVIALPLAPIKDPTVADRLYDGTPEEIEFLDLALNTARQEISMA